MSYYNQPALKAPVWTWEVPAYFFVGGAAGAAALIASAARQAGASDNLVRDARWVAAVGGAISPALLVSDLGRPERFLNMLRVFKLQSPMSVGAWTLVAFSNAAAAAAMADALDRITGGRLPVRLVGNAAETLAAATGLVLSTYTGVLIGATAIPAWSRNVRILPIHFGASGLGAAASILELLSHRDRALNLIGAGAAAIETLIGAGFELSTNAILRPPPGPAQRARLANGAEIVGVPADQDWSGTVIRIGGVLSGPVPLALRLFGGRSASARKTAAISTIVGALMTRFGWIAAGRHSALRS